MQLSLSPSNPPVPPVAADLVPAGTNPAGAADVAFAAIGADAPFEKFLPEDPPAFPRSTRPEGSDMENPAGVLAASFWMLAMAPVSPPVMPAAIDPVLQTLPGSTVLSPTGDIMLDRPESQPPVLSQLETTAGVLPPNDQPPATAGQPPGDGQLSGLIVAAGLPTDSAVPGETDQRHVSPAGLKDAPISEKIAGFHPSLAAAGAAAPAAEIKEILSPNHKTVAAPDTLLGTDVAKSGPPMPFTPSNRPKTGETATPTMALLPTGKPDFTATLPPEAAALPVGTLREMMATVVSALDTLEQRWDAQPKRVDLEFQVGGEPVALRLELKEGTVHATFKTESVRMRTALTREWQAVMPSATVGLLRLAEPVFHAVAGAVADTALGSTGQEALPQRGQPAPESVPFRRVATPADPEISGTSPAAESRPPASVLLNAIA